MKNWVLTTAVIQGTPYYDSFVKNTDPLFRAYAHHHGMAYWPQAFGQGAPALLEVTTGKSPAPRGTESVYANIPFRRSLMNHHDGVVFLDSDLVVVDFDHDVCETVSEEVPIGSHAGAGVMVTKTNDITKALYDTIWAMRHRYLHTQWLDQGAFMHLLGWDPTYPGDFQPARYIGDTAWTPYGRDIGEEWNHHPWREIAGDFYFVHPSGVQPFSRRLEFIESAAQIGREHMEELNARESGL